MSTESDAAVNSYKVLMSRHISEYADLQVVKCFVHLRRLMGNLETGIAAALKSKDGMLLSVTPCILAEMAHLEHECEGVSSLILPLPPFQLAIIRIGQCVLIILGFRFTP
jgi:hypothetical protein